RLAPRSRADRERAVWRRAAAVVAVAPARLAACDTRSRLSSPGRTRRRRRRRSRSSSRLRRDLVARSGRASQACIDRVEEPLCLLASTETRIHGELLRPLAARILPVALPDHRGQAIDIERCDDVGVAVPE